MQHSLHDDRARFSAASDDDRRASPSAIILSCSWVAAPTTTSSSSVDNCMHAGSDSTQAHGSFFRQPFSEEAAADAAAGSYVEELLQLQLPPAASSVEASFDVLSSSDVYETYTSSHCSVGDFDAPPAFSMESFLTAGGGSSASESPKQNVPHTLEFVSPPAPSSCFHSINSKMPEAAAALLPELVQSSQVENRQCAKGGGALHSKANSSNCDEDQQHTMAQIAASSCKKARLQASEQCSRAANDPSQFQAIMSKVQSARSKEKLGERINALQQLVSPFGKTDTASVLSEAIGYIKFLQEQVQVLSSPYMKPTITLTRQDGGTELASDSLRSRGLCLVPVSCTINVANNNNFNIGADYWASTPSVGGGTPTTRFSASS